MRAAAARRLPAIAAMGAAALAFVFLMYALFSKPGPNVVTPGADTAIVSVTPVPAGNGKETSATAQRPSGAIREIVLTLSEGRAEVYSDTGFVGFTPHVVKAALGDHVSLVLRRNGYEDEPVNFIVTEALVPRFTYSLRPRLSPPGSGAYQPFASRTLPRQTSLVQIPFYG
jgi:hypothetical protein